MGPAVVGDDVDVDGHQGRRRCPWATRTRSCRSTASRRSACSTPRRKDLNVEYVEQRGPTDLLMRVHERGVGETRSCGTGACAVVVAHSRWSGTPRDTAYDVEVPGGRLVGHLARLTARPCLSGPAVLGR
jgi:diaminopimelate epimerase